MSAKYVMTLVEESPNPDDLQVIRDGLTAYNLQFATDAQYRSLNIFLRTVDGRVTGGLVGKTSWGWLYVSLLWVDEALRGTGYGSQMLEMAEEEALQRGCHHVYLDTHDFQAPGFYENQGYSLWGTLDNLPIGHKRYFYQKELASFRDAHAHTE